MKEGFEKIEMNKGIFKWIENELSDWMWKLVASRTNSLSVAFSASSKKMEGSAIDEVTHKPVHSVLVATVFYDKIWPFDFMEVW